MIDSNLGYVDSFKVRFIIAISTWWWLLLGLFTWYLRLHVKELSTVHLHLHGLLVQHSHIIPKHTPNIAVSRLPQPQCLKTCCVNLLAKVVAFQGPRSKIISNIGQSV